MNNKLSQKINTLSLLSFALPSILMFVSMSVFFVVDGAIVSRFVGQDALASVNISYPLFNLVWAIGIMLATGGNAFCAKLLGEQQIDTAKKSFSMIVTLGFCLGLLIAIISYTFTPQISLFLGANENLLQYTTPFIKAMSFGMPFIISTTIFQYFFVTIGKPSIGFSLALTGGIINVVFDCIFIIKYDFGIAGAAYATSLGMFVSSIYGFLYFSFKRKSIICFVPFKFISNTINKVSSNGSSEMVSNLALAVTTYLFNKIMMYLAGVSGVAAITILLYSQFLLAAIFMGYSSGVAPLISYNFGANNRKNLKRILIISLRFLLLCSLCIFALINLKSQYLVEIFAKKGTEVFDLAQSGLLLFSFGFLFMGINIFASAMFTAFSNGKISALLSFLRTFLFLISSLFILSKLYGTNGVWTAIPVAEFLTIIFSIYFLNKYKKIYY